MDWKRHENNIYDKIIHWFEVIEEVLQDPAILPENVYNIDETRVMLCMLGSTRPCSRLGKSDVVYIVFEGGNYDLWLYPSYPLKLHIPFAPRM